MPSQEKKAEPSLIEKTLIETITASFKSKSNLNFSQDPDSSEKNVIEYNSRMRVFGLEKFDGPCFLSAVSFYASQKHLEDHDPCGVIVVFLDEEAVLKIMKGFGNMTRADDEETLMVGCGEFCKLIAGDFQNAIGSLGYRNLVVSSPINYKNDAPEGIEFPYSEYKFHEANFYLWKKKTMVVNVVLAPPPR